MKFGVVNKSTKTPKRDVVQTDTSVIKPITQNLPEKIGNFVVDLLDVHFPIDTLFQLLDV